MLKILGSILLIYEPLAYVAITNWDVCESVFSWKFCQSNMLETRVLLFLILPIIISALCLMWGGSLSKIIKQKKDKKTKQKKLEKPLPKIKQQFIDPADSIRNYWLKAGDPYGVAQRSEYWVSTFVYCVLFTVIVMGIGEIFQSLHPDCFEEWVLQEDKVFCMGYTGRYHVLSFIVGIIPIVPQTTLNARRWHDLGWPGFLAIVPIVLLILAAAKSNITIFSVLFGLFTIVQLIAFCFPSKIQNNPYRKRNKKKVSEVPNKKKTYEWQDWD